MIPTQVYAGPAILASPQPQKFLPPLKQVAHGTFSQDVFCNVGFYLVLKYEDHSPACVRSQTIQKLVERGWGLMYSSYAIQNSIKDVNNSQILSIVAGDNSSGLDAVVEQGETVQIPWNIKLEQNYSILNMQLAINSSSGIESWINPIFPYEAINGEKPGKKIITIHADLGIQPGNYTAVISDNGDITNETNLQDIPLKEAPIGLLHLTVVPHNSKISITLGNPHLRGNNYCVGNAQGPNGRFCEGFNSWEFFYITVRSSDAAIVDLSVPNVPDGAWVKFSPQRINVGPEGANAVMTMAGMLGPDTNRLAAKPLIIEAKSINDTVSTVFPVRIDGGLEILHSKGPFNLGSTTLNSDEDGMVIPSVVYDPNDNSSSALQVNLSPLGMVNGNKIVPFPSWFSVKMENSSFTLNHDEPYTFNIETSTRNAPSGGVYTFAMDEEINGTHYIGNGTFSIMNMRM
ncbi:MAG: hypothetical protein KGI25_04945 [Thaumarchaeota archaeon]|nr:hypothetical protein [Nitrososphaerota archaeon]